MVQAGTGIFHWVGSVSFMYSFYRIFLCRAAQEMGDIPSTQTLHTYRRVQDCLLSFHPQRYFAFVSTLSFVLHLKITAVLAVKVPHRR